MLHQDQPDSRESCIVLQSRPTRNLVAKFPQRLVFACSMQILCCRGRTRPWTGVCEPLMPDVMALKAHQNNRSYVSSEDLPSDSLRKILAWLAVTRRTWKNHKTVKIWGRALAWVWVLTRDNTVLAQYVKVHSLRKITNHIVSIRRLCMHVVICCSSDVPMCLMMWYSNDVMVKCVKECPPIWQTCMMLHSWITRIERQLAHQRHIQHVPFLILPVYICTRTNMVTTELCGNEAYVHSFSSPPPRLGTRLSKVTICIYN